MRSILTLTLVALIVCACGSKSENQVKEDYGDPKPTSGPNKVSQDLVAQGAALVKKSDCNTCHHVTNTIVGPAHTDVAKKYAFTNENIELLANRIINGSQGVWGQVMMTPHPDLSKDDALKMARYVLSLDGEAEPEQ